MTASPVTAKQPPSADAAALLLEARLIMDVVASGLLRSVAAASSIKHAVELDTLRRLSNRAGDRLATVQEMLLVAPAQGNGA
jgi:hypothetical protein